MLPIFSCAGVSLFGCVGCWGLEKPHFLVPSHPPPLNGVPYSCLRPRFLGYGQDAPCPLHHNNALSLAPPPYLARAFRPPVLPQHDRALDSRCHPASGQRAPDQLQLQPLWRHLLPNHSRRRAWMKIAMTRFPLWGILCVSIPGFLITGLPGLCICVCQ